MTLQADAAALDPAGEILADRPPEEAPAPPRQTAFVQAWRIAMARPRLFAVGIALYALYYSLPLLPGLLQRQIFDTLGGGHPAGLNVWSLIGLWFAAQLSPLAERPWVRM